MLRSEVGTNSARLESSSSQERKWFTSGRGPRRSLRSSKEPVFGMILSNPPRAKAIVWRYYSRQKRHVKPMKKNNTREAPQSARTRLLEELATIERICQGTLLRRTKVCGRPGCRCALDPQARHGPYYEWSRLEKGRLVHSVVSREQAQEIIQAIRDFRRIQRTLRRWQLNSGDAILARKPRKR